MSNIFDELTATGMTRKFTLGTTRCAGGRNYVYVQLCSSAANAAVAGTVLYGTPADSNVVTDDISASHPNLVRGVAIGPLAIGAFGWIQTWGEHSAVKTDGGDDIATGDAIIGDPTVDGVCDSVAAGTAPTHKVVGFATSADSNTANTVAAYLTLEKGD